MPDKITIDPLRSVFLHLVETKAEPYKPPVEALVLPPEPEEDSALTTRNEGRGAARVMRILSLCPLMLDQHGSTYIQIEDDVYLLDSKNPRLVEKVASLYWRASEKTQTMGKDALTAAVSILSHDARESGQLVPMANRAAPYGEAIYYDLGNRNAIKIQGGRWEVVTALPGLFRDWGQKLPYPVPLPGGNAKRLFDFINVTEDRFLFILATLTACLVPGVSRPAIIITGPQGSGKSTFAYFLKMLVDPGNPALTLVPRKPEDLDLMLSRNFFLVLDNISNLAPEMADILAGVITGAAPQRRRLHTDNELLTLHTDLTICFTSINALSNRPDFMERTLRFELERIEDLQRLSDDEINQGFSAALPEILGGLFDLLAKGLELLPNYRPERLPRMASFARIAAAVAEASEPGGGNRYLSAYFKNQGAQQLELADGNSLFGAILEACHAGNYPSGTFKQVTSTLKEIAEPDPKDRSFPSGPRGLRPALERLRVPLRTAGIGYQIDEHRTAAGKASVSFFAVEKSEDMAAPAAKPAADLLPLPPEPPALGGLVFDPAELD